MSAPSILAISAVLLTACSTVTETFSPDGKVTSRTKAPSPETWTAVSNAVALFGSQAVSSWATQMADQQRWEKGGK